jgi:hypothetical protein
MLILGFDLLSWPSVGLAAHFLERRVTSERNVTADRLPSNVLLGLRPSAVGMQGSVGFRTRARRICRLKFFGERRGRNDWYRL